MREARLPVAHLKTSHPALVLLLGIFLLTRSAGAWLADHPIAYGRNVTSDAELYQYWADRISGGEAPYTDVPVEYPPGLLPFILAPKASLVHASYRTSLIWLMLLIDALGLFGLIITARRWGSMLGPWLWVLVIPLIGPIVYVRLDLVPAVATIWAVERLSAGAWGGAGGWMGLATAAKLYPALLLPLVVLVIRRWRRFIGWTVVVLALAFLPFALSPRGILRNVFGYHAGRDIHIESTWGLVLLLASKLGYKVSLGFGAGSFNALSSISTPLKVTALACSVLGVAAGAFLAARTVPRDDTKGLVALMFGTLSLAIGLGTVFSPQFVLWMLALAAAASCARSSPGRAPALVLIPIAVLTQLLYPFQYRHLIAADGLGLVLLGLRNGLVLAVALSVFVLMWRRTGASRAESTVSSVSGGIPTERIR
jgi:Glycosyltransferase family 87